MRTFRTEAPHRPCDIILGNRTDTSVTASVLAYSPIEGYCEFGARQGEHVARSDLVRLESGMPREVILDDLVPDSQYFYRWRSRVGPEDAFEASDEFSFRTGRADGDAFVSIRCWPRQA